MREGHVVLNVKFTKVLLKEQQSQDDNKNRSPGLLEFDRCVRQLEAAALKETNSEEREQLRQIDNCIQLVETWLNKEETALLDLLKGQGGDDAITIFDMQIVSKKLIFPYKFSCVQSEQMVLLLQRLDAFLLQVTAAEQKRLLSRKEYRRLLHEGPKWFKTTFQVGSAAAVE